MKHKQLLSLICAAGVVLASVPALPVIAAETAPVSTAAEQREITEDGDLMLNGTTEDGCWWEVFNTGNAGTVAQTAGKYGSFQFSWKDVKNAQFVIDSRDEEHKRFGAEARLCSYEYACKLDLGDTGYYGVQAIPKASSSLYIVEGWAENSPVLKNAGKKLGTVSANGLQYDVYRCEQPNDNPDSRTSLFPDYWFISCNNRYDAKEKRLVKGSVPVYQLADALYASGLDPQMAPPYYSENPHMFVYSGADASGKASGSVDFSYSWYGGDYALPESLRSEDGYALDFSGIYGIGTTNASIGKNGNFELNWKDTENAYAMLYPTETVSERDMLGKTWQYSGEIDLGGNGYYGLLAHIGTRWIVIVEGRDENCTEWDLPKKLIGQVKYENTVYDLYENTAEAYPAPFDYWCIRTDNPYDGHKTTVSGEIPLLPILDQTADIIGINETERVYSSEFFVNSGRSDTAFLNGSASFSKCRFGYTDRYFTEQGTKDGYNWLRCQAAYEYGTSMTAGDKGTFKAAWKDLDPVVGTLFVSGREYNNISLDDVQSISCSYEVKTSVNPNYFSSYWNYGYEATFADLSGEEPVLTEYYVTDAAPSVHAPFTNKDMQVAQFRIGDIFYNVYQLSVNDETVLYAPVAPQHFTKTQYWIERYWDFHDGNITVSDSLSVDLLQIFKELEKNGLKPEGTLTDISFYALADSGTGSLEVLKNEISLVKTGEAAPETIVRGDANCDGALDVSDAVLASRIVVEDTEAKISDQGLRNADIDLNGNLEPADITLMLQVIARKVKL